jgi:hypothetical protein
VYEFNIVSNAIDFLGAILGGVLSSIIFVVFWDHFKKPALRFEWLTTDPITLYVNGRLLGLYHIKVHNYGRSTAENCYLTIIYRDYKSDPIITLKPGKWDENPEPVTRDPINPNNHLFDLSFLHLMGRVSIRAKSSATFCFLIKYDGDASCFGFNADNYRTSNLTPNDRRLEIGEFLITFDIGGDNVKSDATFLLKKNGISHRDVTLNQIFGNYY